MGSPQAAPAPQTLRVALAQINTTVGDLSGNIERVWDAARRAAALGADLVAAPELAISGYPPEDLLLRGSFLAACERALAALAARARGLPPIVVGVPEGTAGLPYNAAAVVHDGRVVGRYRKHRLPNYGVFDELRYFQPGSDLPLFEIAGVPVGVTVCEDLWSAAGPAAPLAARGARLLVNINASPFHAGKSGDRERIIADRARESGLPIAYVNQVGGQDELVFDGHSLVAGPDGQPRARGASMREDLLVMDVPLAPPRPLAAPPIPVTPAPPAGAGRPPLPAPPTAPPDPLAETYDALVLGTRDYVRKTGFRDALVACSGGIDSALVAAVAVDALGPAHVRGVSLPSRYSSAGSVADAEQLAALLGIELWSLPIEALHAAALETLAAPFAGTEPGVAEENIQSRIRGMLMMALSNKFGALVLTTGNKSEYACGYATLYGDMVGGYAVIKDVPKTLVWALARHRNERGPAIPERSITKPPSAELRPDQLDTDSLPPYEVLDPILEAYIERDEPEAAIVARGFDAATVRRVLALVDRNEYKRRQAAPGIKITPRAFGRDRRMPIAMRETTAAPAPDRDRPDTPAAAPALPPPGDPPGA